MHRLICFIASVAILGVAGKLIADDSNGTETDTHALGQVAESEPKRLTIADQAPALEIVHWIKGDAIEAFEPGNVYVIEFWATWCGLCLAAMPHVSAVQDQYRDYGVTVVGISDEPLQTIVEFLTRERKEGELWYHTIRFTLATDPERRAHVAYMRSAGQRSIPTAFIIGKSGKVEWIGHPMHMDNPLDKIVHDRWDRDAFRAEFIAQQDHERQVTELMLKMRQNHAAGDWHNVLAALDALIELEPSPFYQVERFMTLLRDMNEPARAYAYAEQIAKERWDQAQVLNQIARLIVDEEGIEVRDLDFALRVARRANELTENEDAATLDALARVYYERGDLDNAVKWQRTSVEHSRGVWYADDLKATLEQYEAELLARD